MPMLTLEDARALESSFEGRITSSHDAHAEFRSKPPVLIPGSADDVKRALYLARAANRRVVVRSGGGISSDDVSESDAAVVSMEAFREVDVDADAGRITVGPAATTADVAKKLADTSLFLPLDDDPTQSIVSAVLGTEGSPFPRSTAGIGSLRGAVAEADVVPIEGDGAGISITLRGDALRALWVRRRSGVVTRLVFDTSAWSAAESRRWLQAWVTPYEPSAFAGLCDALSGVGAVPEHVDLSVRVTSAAFSMKLVLIRATGRGDADQKVAEAAVRDALDRSKCAVLSAERVEGPGSSIAAWVATGPGSAREHGEVHARFGSDAAPRRFAAFRDDFLAAVEFAIGVDARTGRKHAPGLEAWAELQLAPGGDVLARAQVADATADPGVAQEAHRRMAQAIPAHAPWPAAEAASLPLLRRAPARAALRFVEVLPAFAPTPDFDLLPSNRAGSGKIPGFEGDVFAKADNKKDYVKTIKQYAVSSYGREVVQARMMPHLVAEPAHAEDVVTAVTYAAKRGLKIVARSGGHQYCGLSSGGDTTVVLDMRRFKKVAFSPDTDIDTPTQVTVGPGVRLLDLSAALRKRGVVLPHGECPLVNVGGHVQTGGVGHQLRSLGLTLDWVRSFKMVTRDPTAAGADVYVEREFKKPQGGGGDAGGPTDDDVFKAVLGGGPGSWGVLTEITFDLVPDGRYPTSHGYSGTYLYNKAAFRVAMEQLLLWANRAAAGQLPAGMDLFLTVVSGEFSLLRPDALVRPPALLVETMCKEEAGVKEIKAVMSAVEEALPFGGQAAAAIGRVLAHGVKGREDLSVIADAGVRRIGAFGLPASGREFDLPYKKALYITRTPFSAAFCDGFVDLVDRVNAQQGVKVVFQAVIGGGEFGSNGKNTTHMQRRDALVQLVFDVFYEPEHRATAESFQAQMKALLPAFCGDARLRMFWGTFEDEDTNGSQLDMNKPTVQQLYYDSPAEYARLQQIKKYVDAGDVFRTSFTVQLPP